MVSLSGDFIIFQIINKTEFKSFLAQKDEETDKSVHSNAKIVLVIDVCIWWGLGMVNLYE